MSIPRDNAVNHFRSSQSIATHRLFLPGGVAGSLLSQSRQGAGGWNSAPIPIATIQGGVTPAGMAISADGRFGYLANNNNYGVTTGNYVSVLDLTANMPLAKISSGTFNQPYTATLSTDGSKCYITNSAGQTLTVISTATQQVLGTIGGFDGPSGLAITGTVGYVNNYGATPGVGSGNGTTVSVVNLTSQTIIGTLTTDQAPAALALSPNGAFLYVINYTTGLPGAGTLQVFSTATNALVQTIGGFSGPFGIAIHPDGTRAYVTNFGSNNFDPYGTTLSVVNLINYTVVADVEIGIQPSGVAVSPDGKYVYVSSYNTLYQVGAPTFSGLTAGQGTVGILDTATNTLVPVTIPVGQSPSNLSILPSGDAVYVSNYTSGTVSVLRGLF